MLRITLQGMEDAEKQLKRIERGSRAMGRYQAMVYSRMPYAWGAEYGRHKVSGKLARRRGGTHYLTASLQRVQAEGDRDISEGLNKVTAPGPWVLRRLGLWVRRLARARAPRGGPKGRPYTLSKSISYRVTRNG